MDRSKASRGVRLLLVEDHQILAQTLATALGAEGYQVRCADELDSASVFASAEGWADVVVLDLDLGGGRLGVPLVQPLREAGIEVLILTGRDDRRLHAEALEAGALGVVSKSSALETLLDAIRTAARGAAVTSPNLREELLAELHRARIARRNHERAFGNLTERERNVLIGLVKGRSAEAIAEEQVVSLSTVRTHIRGILTKLGVNSQLEAMALARQAGWPREDA